MALTTIQTGWLNGKPVYYGYATGATALAETLAPGYGFELMRIELHLNAAATQETFTATMDAGRGTAYDTLVFSQAMSGYTDVINTMQGEGYTYLSDDEIDFAWTNTDTKTYGLTVVWRKL